MSQKPLAWTDSDENVSVARMPAYWAVMLTGRDTSSMVNMLPFEEKYVLYAESSAGKRGTRDAS